MEYNERQVSERWLSEKFEEKLNDVQSQKVCIAKYKQFLDYVKNVDVDNVSSYEQNRMLSAYLFCSIGNKKVRIHDNFASYTSKVIQFQENVNGFNHVELASRLIGDCVEKKIWFDKTYLLDYGAYVDYGWFEYLKICRPYAKIACDASFDDSTTYTEQQILQFIKTKRLFLIDLGFEETEQSITFGTDVKYVNTPNKNTLIVAKNVCLGDCILPAGTILTNRGHAIAETYENYKNLKPYIFDNSLLASNRSRYLQSYQLQTHNVYPDFSKVLLKYFINSVPNEINARIKKLKQTKAETEKFVKENYANYKKTLEKKIEQSQKQENEKLQKLRNLPEENSSFEF